MRNIYVVGDWIIFHNPTGIMFGKIISDILDEDNNFCFVIKVFYKGNKIKSTIKVYIRDIVELIE